MSQPGWARRAVKAARPRRCRGCWVRRAREQHHWLWHARWRSGRFSFWRRWVQRFGPTVWLCKVCHHRVTSWDVKPWTPLPLVTLAGMLTGFVKCVVFPGLIVYLSWRVFG